MSDWEPVAGHSMAADIGLMTRTTAPDASIGHGCPLHGFSQQETAMLYPARLYQEQALSSLLVGDRASSQLFAVRTATLQHSAAQLCKRGHLPTAVHRA